MITKIFKSVFYNHRYVTSLAIRFIIIVVTEYLYKHYHVLYTDIDYHVFSDGAKHISVLESPYERETYRYTPILAAMMIPNIRFWYPIGKFLLSTIDVCVGYLIELVQIKKGGKDKTLEESIEEKESSNLAAYSSLFYLYNPLTVVICTRGSADCIITFLVLSSLYFLEKRWYITSAFLYGFAVHFKIYPIIYAPALYLYLVSKEYDKNYNENTIEKEDSYIKYLLKRGLHSIKNIFFYLYKFKSLSFVIVSASTFFFFLIIFYVWLGDKFLFEYLLYHVVRKDHRHNYSMFYYLIYLTYDSDFSKLLSMIAFLPQMSLIFLCSLFLYKNIHLCLIVLTMIFVFFNKVMTAQYFIWFFSLIPLIINKNKLFGEKKIKGIVMLLVWLFFEGIWNSYSHFLEYDGRNTFLEMWIIDVVFFLINCYCIMEILVNSV